MIFAGIGVWLIFRRDKLSKETIFSLKKEMIMFALIIGLVGVYVSSAFVRLEVFAAISVIILSSIGLAILTQEIFKIKTFSEKKKVSTSSVSRKLKISYVVGIVILLVIPTILPVNGNWINGIKAPPTILNGGTTYNIATDDWPDALNWIKQNTPNDAVIASWWDYGYWITTLGERKSLADNATINSTRIQQIAKTFLSTPDNGWEILQDMDADYFLIYVAAQRVGSAADPEETPLYLLTGGADESKKQWFIRIAREPIEKYLHPDGFSGTEFFWQNTLLGKMFPFSPAAYVNLNNNLQSPNWQQGYTGIYVKDVKFPEEGDGPLRLVYSSPSWTKEESGVISGIFIYEINEEYKKQNSLSKTSETPLESSDEVAILTTNFGDITIKFREDLAPKTVENFKTLANSGFYDGTIFHRIIPDFVIQGGDPNTIPGSNETWGMGGPGYSIEPEFSDIKHTKYIVSMARSQEIDSAGSQFFIVLGDSPWLDGQYTIFGEVISGKEVVDKIGSLETDELDQPINPQEAVIQKIKIANP